MLHINLSRNHRIKHQTPSNSARLPFLGMVSEWVHVTMFSLLQRWWPQLGITIFHSWSPTCLAACPTPWKSNMVHLQINHVGFSKMIFLPSKPPFVGSKRNPAVGLINSGGVFPFFPRLLDLFFLFLFGLFHLFLFHLCFHLCCRPWIPGTPGFGGENSSLLKGTF